MSERRCRTGTPGRVSPSVFLSACMGTKPNNGGRACAGGMPPVWPQGELACILVSYTNFIACMPLSLSHAAAPAFRSTLVRLVLACVLPLAGCAALLIVHVYQSEQAGLAATALNRARAVALSLDLALATTGALIDRQAAAARVLAGQRLPPSWRVALMTPMPASWRAATTRKASWASWSCPTCASASPAAPKAITNRSPSTGWAC